MTNGEPFYQNVIVTTQDGSSFEVKVQLQPPGHVQEVITAYRANGWTVVLGQLYDSMGNPTTGSTPPPPPPGPGGTGQQGDGGSQAPSGGGDQAPEGGGKRPGPEVAVTQSQAALAVFALGAVGALGVSHHRRKRRR